MATYTFQNGDAYPKFPTDNQPQRFNIKHARRVVKSDPRSLRRQTRALGGVRIELNVVYAPMSEDEFESMIEFLNTLDENTLFAYKFPRIKPSSVYGQSGFTIGEYYNRDSATLENQLVQYLGTGPTIDPPARQTGTVTLNAWDTKNPYLLCSLASQHQIRYPEDGHVRVELDLVERWTT